MNGKWQTLSSESAIEHPSLRVTMDTVLLPSGEVIADWPTVHAGDYVNVLVVNSEGNALIAEGYRHGSGRVTWQTIGGYIGKDEDPYTAAQRELRTEAGLECSQWRHLNSFVVDAHRHVGTGHFFIAYNPKDVKQGKHDHPETSILKWVSVVELKHALWDGRLNVMSYGVNVALALLALGDL
ncbi:MAG TPA: NUDIX hydrolase [Anaerolineae bacterium]|nr:NUDIX hydrolase [Anaerolineae bacterium]